MAGVPEQFLQLIGGGLRRNQPRWRLLRFIGHGANNRIAHRAVACISTFCKALSSLLCRMLTDWTFYWEKLRNIVAARVLSPYVRLPPPRIEAKPAPRLGRASAGLGGKIDRVAATA